MTRTLYALLALPFLAACPPSSGADDDDSASDDDDAAVDPTSFSFENSGDPGLEGHTPRGFQGQGGGLFAGDNLNPNFPDGDGVQIFLTVDLARGDNDEDLLDGGWTIQSALLSSDNVDFNGTPFVDLGDLTAEEIRFDDFSSALWNADVEPGGQSCVFATSTDGPFECDLAQALQNSLDDGYDRLQLRFQLDEAGDSDGQADMVLFHLGDTNATEPGIFSLEVEAVPAD